MNLEPTLKQALFALHEETCKACLEVMRKKNTDYSGGSGDPYANFRIAEMFGLHPVTGILLRVTDKLQRIRAFIKTNVSKVCNRCSVVDTIVIKMVCF